MDDFFFLSLGSEGSGGEASLMFSRRAFSIAPGSKDEAFLNGLLWRLVVVLFLRLGGDIMDDSSDEQPVVGEVLLLLARGFKDTDRRKEGVTG